MKRWSASVVVAAYFGLIVVAAALATMDGSGKSPRRVIGYGQVGFDGAGPERWAARFRRERRAVIRLRRQLHAAMLFRPTTGEAIRLACAVYGSCDTLWRRARCESGFDRTAQNASGASGLFQFLPSTWNTTPFASLSIWSPYANALAAGWMQANGRGGEWVCR